MTWWLGLLIGLVIGGSLGIVVGAMLAMAGQDDDSREWPVL